MIRTQRIYTVLLVCLSGLILQACSSIQTRNENATSLAQKNRFNKHVYSSALFNIVSFQKITSDSSTISIYIEGDGLAWKNRRRISSNPTPINPVALKLAIEDKADNIIYLARPCQYVDIEKEKNCVPEYWTAKRASIEVIDSLNDVINQIVSELNTSSIRLVGFSGGATIAAILAATRKDVKDLRTVAGNLDIHTFTSYHQVTPLHGSLNPTDYAKELSLIPQRHYYSDNDEIIVPEIMNSYLSSLKEFDSGLKCVGTVSIPETTHTAGWVRAWPELSKDKPDCASSNKY